MSESKELKEVLPLKGLLYQEESSPLALCRPKLMPLKSVTLERLEQMQEQLQHQSRQQMEQEHMQEQQLKDSNASKEQ